MVVFMLLQPRVGRTDDHALVELAPAVTARLAATEQPHLLG